MYWEGAAYAELGFIVVMINCRGNDGLRNRAFNTYQDSVLPIKPNLPLKYNKLDCVEGIRQLASRYRYMDLERVGVTEFVSTPMALAGLLIHPEFYKVGVTRNPMANYAMASCLGMDAAEFPQLEQFAGNLEGKL